MKNTRSTKEMPRGGKVVPRGGECPPPPPAPPNDSGGGIYLYKSEMTPCQTISALKLSGNTTMEKGGGIYAVGSLIKAKVPTVKNLIQKYSMIYLVTVVHS